VTKYTSFVSSIGRSFGRAFFAAICVANSATSSAGSIAQSPLFLGVNAPPLVLITMGRDHKLYYEAYNDASDLNGDGVLDVGYNPAIDYFGYFDSYKCYSYGSGIFSPTARTMTKKCSGEWSGDFLNYLTTSRMDALRKVLYGGYRSTDSTAETILERVFIPQDAHSWGKEYKDVTTNGFDISQYTPLSAPYPGTRHLFANTTLYGTSDPLLRVLTDSAYRVWEWLSIERPVAGTQCATGNNTRANCATGGSTYWEIVPSGYFSNLTQTTYLTPGYTSSPVDGPAFTSLVSTYGTTANRSGSGPAANVNGSGNPFGAGDYYFTLFDGQLVIPEGAGGTYTFAVDGDDAVDVLIDGSVIASWYGQHSKCDCTTHSGSVTLAAGAHTFRFRHQERNGNDYYYLRWQRTIPASTMTDYTVRVKACVDGLLETDCKAYKSGSTTIYKPTGLLHEHGEDDAMMFGLLTGSYTKNTSGGIIRKNVLSFRNEVNAATGQFINGVGGIVETINKLKTVGFGSGYSYDQNCTVPEVNQPLREGYCRMWGNPIGEMIYEGLRYFSGKSGPTSDFSIGTSGDDANLGLPKPNWLNPYAGNMGTTYPSGYPTCSRPSQLIISDINPSYDTDKVPGTSFGSYSGDLSGFNASTEAGKIWGGESEATRVFIGESQANTPSYDGAPTPKTVNSFNNIRGLAPEEPTREGGFYSAAAALFGKTHDLNAVSGPQKTDTFSVVLASPLPRIEIPVAGQTVTLVPFGKTVGGCGTFNRNQGYYQPTNTIVDFYVDTIRNTAAVNYDASINGGRPYGKFRINYEDSEYGSDHDMDAIVEYTFAVQADNTVSISLRSDYAAGGCIQHMGYVISGTTADGTYLEVRDSDTNSDVDYFLDTPPGQLPGGTWSDGQGLPLTTSRAFSVGSTTSASYLKHDPLWYAAKWGGFFDKKNPSTNLGNDQLDGDEWDLDHDGVPDSYFLVTNAGKLKEQLTKAFNEIKARVGSAASIATNSTRLDTGTHIYQAKFNSEDWSGQLLAFQISSNGSITDRSINGVRDGIIDAKDALWDARDNLPAAGERAVFSYDPTPADPGGIAFQWTNLNDAQQLALAGTADDNSQSGLDLVAYLRGDQSKEKNNGPFRPRETVLGDIVNSDPLFVGSENFGYKTLPVGGSAYASFLSSKASRVKMLYVGANDGMLHAFRVDTGAELFAYLPGLLVDSHLATLASEPYAHRYFVDGSPRAGDAYLDGAWHTILVGTTGAGGRGVFALDVTNPAAFNVGNVLWEFTGTSDADLGYTLPQASVVQMADGSWAAIVANGYNSPAGHAVLFILDLRDGSVIRKIDTGAAGNSVISKNGLSTPIAIDKDQDRVVDYIYAGDLVGNLWKFDVSDPDPGAWGVAGGTSPFFVACASSTVPCSDANRQPITGKPQVGKATDAMQVERGGGLMVYFGTGKYFEDGDSIVPDDPQLQTFYGLWDTDPEDGTLETIPDRGELQVQSIVAETSKGAFDLRVTTSNPVNYADAAVVVKDEAGNDLTLQPQKGWYLDLKPASGVKQGERVVTYPLLRGERVIFVTVIPSPNPCDYGGTSWLMELAASSGQRSASAPFDIYGANGAPDGVINTQDLVSAMIGAATRDLAPSGKKSNIGIIKTPGVIGGGELEYKYTSGSSGELEVTTETGADAGGRQTWIQLR